MHEAPYQIRIINYIHKVIIASPKLGAFCPPAIAVEGEREEKKKGKNGGGGVSITDDVARTIDGKKRIRKKNKKDSCSFRKTKAEGEEPPFFYLFYFFENV